MCLFTLGIFNSAMENIKEIKKRFSKDILDTIFSAPQQESLI